MNDYEIKAANEYRSAIYPRLLQALGTKSLELEELGIKPGEDSTKFVIIGLVARPIALIRKPFAFEIVGKLGKLDEHNVDACVDFMLPRIINAFYGENVDSVTI